MKAPARVTDAHQVLDGRYEGAAIWVDLQVDAECPVEKNGIRWSFAMDRDSALLLRRALNKALRQPRG